MEPQETSQTPRCDMQEMVRLLMEQRAMIYGFVFAIVRDHDAAEEIFQEVSVAVCESCADFEPGTNFGAWAREIARRRIFAHNRKAARFPVSLSDEGLARLQMGFDAVHDEQPSVGQDRLRALRSCLQQVGPKSRRLLELRYEGRSSLKDMARQLARQPESVRKALYRTRQVLKVCIERRLRLGTEDA